MQNEKSVHYVCPGTCGGVSGYQKSCEADDCNFYGQTMHRCDCEDGLHRQDAPTDSATASALV